MSNVLKFLKGSIPGGEHVDVDPADFVHYEKISRFGYPRDVKCAAFDIKCNLLALGTDDGYIHVLGGGNARWIHPLSEDGRNRRSPLHIYSVYGKGLFLVICSDFSILRFSIKGSEIGYSAADTERLKKDYRAAVMLQGRETQHASLLIGTSTGLIWGLDTETLSWFEFMSCAPQGSINSPRAITSIAACRDAKTVAIAYDDNRIAIYDSSRGESNLYVMSPDLTGLYYGSSTTLLISFRDGTFRTLENDKERVSDAQGVFGPFPASPILSMHTGIVKRDSNPVLIFTGGMPAASYGDRYTITLKSGQNVLCLDFEAPIISSFVSQEEDDEGTVYDSCLLVVTKSELVVIDLRHPKWLPMPCRYYYPMDAQAVTASTLLSDISEHAWNELNRLSELWWNSKNNEYSLRRYPLCAHKQDQGEHTKHGAPVNRQVLITGHDNGSLNVWNASEKCCELLFSIQTSAEFTDGTVEDVESVSQSTHASTDLCSEVGSEPGELVGLDASDNWPPFRKVGVYDTLCEDRRLAITKVFIDPTTAEISAGNSSGLVFIYILKDETKTYNVKSESVILVQDPAILARAQADAEKPPAVRSMKRVYPPGFHPFSKPTNAQESYIWKLTPSFGVSALTCLPKLNIFAASNEYGLVVMNTLTSETLLNTSFIDHEELAGHNVGNVWAMYKSMKQSVRKTFRRKARNPRTDADNSLLSNDPQTSDIQNFTEDEFRPIERKIEARPQTTQVDTKGYLVRFLQFLKTPTANGVDTETLWVGLNGGRLFCYALVRKPRMPFTLKLEKEVILSHGAPILFFTSFVDNSNKSSPQHRLLVVTEEQIRIYNLPAMKHLKFKAKLTSFEGYRIRKASLVQLHSKNDSSIVQPFIVCLTNAGEMRVYSPCSSKVRVRLAVLSHADQIGMGSVVISSSGDVFYLRGGQTEYQHDSLSSHSLLWTPPFSNSTWPQ